MRTLRNGVKLIYLPGFLLWLYFPVAAQQIPDAGTLPYSSGILIARAIHAGTISPATFTGRATANQTALTCSPSPCVLPNMQISEGGFPVNETPIVANPQANTQLLAGANDYNCGSFQGVYTSNDSGSTWSHTCVPTLLRQFGAGDPGVAYDTSNHAYFTGIDCAAADCSTSDSVVFQRSSTNGATWTRPRTAVKPTFGGGIVDKPWLAIDTSLSSPYRDRLYVSATQFGPGNSSQISVSHSANRGSRWETVLVDSAQAYPTIDQFSDLAIAQDGTVYLSWMRCSATNPYQNCGGTTATLIISRSQDGGLTWTSPSVLGTAVLAPDTCGCSFYGNLPNTGERVSEIPVLAIDMTSGPFAGRLYATFYEWTGAYMVALLSYSTDGGVTWSSPVRATPVTDTHDQFFPWISVSGQGLVSITFLDRRNDPFNIFYDAFVALSNDGGSTFTNVKLSSVISNPYADGFLGLFMGDYIGNTWAGEVLYMTYADTRNGIDAQDELAGYIP